MACKNTKLKYYFDDLHLTITTHGKGRPMKKTALLTLATMAFALGGMFQPAAAETLRVGMECTYAPFNFKTAAGELDGYDVDVAKGVAKIVGADLKFVCQKWDGMIPALLANKFDLVIASM